MSEKISADKTLDVFVAEWMRENWLDDLRRNEELAQAVAAFVREKTFEEVEPMVTGHEHWRGNTEGCPRCAFEKLKVQKGGT